MDSIQKTTVICLLVLLLPISFSVIGLGADTGNFAVVTENEKEYYPETVLSVSLVNLTTNDNYALLIGANQNTVDQQWDNFTATASSMTRDVIHFTTQSYIDNNSLDITHLMVKLYDNTSNQLDYINYYVISVKQELNPYYVGMLLFVCVGTLVLFNILFIILKKFF